MFLNFQSKRSRQIKNMYNPFTTTTIKCPLQSILVLMSTFFIQEFEKNWEESRQGRVDSWMSFTKVLVFFRKMPVILKMM